MNTELQKEDMTLDEAFGKVEAVLDRLEAEDTTLENSFQMYQEGMRLLKICNDKIDRVEKQVLVMDEKGELNEF
ncbi:MAG: exodeoxyribonuclease VII small subunit [bacterium]|nr:exodeoxyribonuclease VII small subunit [bacterium]